MQCNILLFVAFLATYSLAQNNFIPIDSKPGDTVVMLSPGSDAAQIASPGQVPPQNLPNFQVSDSKPEDTISIISAGSNTSQNAATGQVPSQNLPYLQVSPVQTDHIIASPPMPPGNNPNGTYSNSKPEDTISIISAGSNTSQTAAPGQVPPQNLPYLQGIPVQTDYIIASPPMPPGNNPNGIYFNSKPQNTNFTPFMGSSASQPAAPGQVPPLHFAAPHQVPPQDIPHVQGTPVQYADINAAPLMPQENNPIGTYPHSKPQNTNSMPFMGSSASQPAALGQVLPSQSAAPYQVPPQDIPHVQATPVQYAVINAAPPMPQENNPIGTYPQTNVLPPVAGNYQTGNRLVGNNGYYNRYPKGRQDMFGDRYYGYPVDGSSFGRDRYQDSDERTTKNSYIPHVKPAMKVLLNAGAKAIGINMPAFILDTGFEIILKRINVVLEAIKPHIRTILQGTCGVLRNMNL